MKQLNIRLENCFGIGLLNHKFDFETSTSFLIYAPNGTMKTSFAKTFDLIAKDDPKDMPRDRIYKSRTSIHKVFNEESPLNPDDILVINAEDTTFDASNQISNFLASKDLKSEYDQIYSKLNIAKVEFIKKLKVISQSSDCETEFIKTFSGDDEKSEFFEVLNSQRKSFKAEFEKHDFKYNEIFDKKGNVKKFLDKNKSLIDQYITDYKEILSKSTFFKESSDNSFGTYQANTVIKSIEDNSFFEAGHKFVLDDGTEIGNAEKLKTLVEKEIQSILGDENLKKSFDKVDKAMGSNNELRSFKSVLENNNLILIKLRDYESFKQEVWINYFSEIKNEAHELLQLYEEEKSRLEEIVNEARKEFKLWASIVETFNARFHVPFMVRIENQDDIILKEETANLIFDYADRGELPIKQDRESLLTILSKGEQRAYFLLHFLFEIEARKLKNNKNLLIFDDVADSFDYKNKFAIIEYIKEIHEKDLFKIIILTHNFDFYRTVASRLYLNRGKNEVLMATKSLENKITLNAGQYVNDIFSLFIKNYKEPKFFIGLIPFVRNLIEYSDTKENNDYLVLTKCLHRKVGSEDLKMAQVFNIFKDKLKRLEGKDIDFGEQKVIDFIIDTANSISDDVDEIALENKICLAIAIRLEAEKYLIDKLPGEDLNIKKNQTQILYTKYCETHPDSEAIMVLDQVNLMTPENIHINAFMFEPLIDMSIKHLIKLYKQVNNLNTPIELMIP